MSAAKFIVLYGPNNIGKSTQVRLLAKHLIDEEKEVLILKYPIYDLQPTGPLINDVLRHNKKMSDLELQKAYAQNRRDFQPTLEKILAAGIYVVAEDYTGTGIAWGMTMGVDLKTLEEMNDDLLQPDLAILLDGPRFKKAVEKGHRHEDAGDEVWQKNRKIHLQLAKRYGWIKVKVDSSPEKVHQKVWQVIKEKLKLN